MTNDSKQIAELEATVAEQRQLIKDLKENLLLVAAHFIGAASAYEKYARRMKHIKPVATTDPFFTIRNSDFKKVVDTITSELPALVDRASKLEVSPKETTNDEHAKRAKPRIINH